LLKKLKNETGRRNKINLIAYLVDVVVVVVEPACPLDLTCFPAIF